MARALLALGANLGDRAATLDAAVKRLSNAVDTRVMACSRWHETEPVGGPAGQEAFLNGAIVVETSLSPTALLARLHAVEHTLGRERTIVWGPRTIDIDLLLYDDLCIRTPELQVPHPRLAVRRFVLAPAAEIAAPWFEPTSGWTIGRLWEHLRTAFPYFALTSIPGANLTRLAQDVLGEQPGELLSDSLPREWTADVLERHHRARVQMLEQLAQRVAPVISDFWSGEIPVLAQALAAQPAHVTLSEAARESRPEAVRQSRPESVRKTTSAHEPGAHERSTHERSTREPSASRELLELAAATAPREPKVRIWVEPAQVDGEWSQRLRDALYAAATRPGSGPWLSVTETDRTGAVRDIAAAVSGS